METLIRRRVLCRLIGTCFACLPPIRRSGLICVKGKFSTVGTCSRLHCRSMTNLLRTYNFVKDVQIGLMSLDTHVI